MPSLYAGQAAKTLGSSALRYQDECQQADSRSVCILPGKDLHTTPGHWNRKSEANNL